METKTIDQMSSVELEKLLAEKRREEEKERKRQRGIYEKNRDAMIIKLSHTAKEISVALKVFKAYVFKEIENFQELAQEYGDIRSNSKGGYSLRTTDGTFKVVYERNILNEFDERADMALSLIKDYLESSVKKRDLKSYKIISTLLTRNKAGDLNVSRVIQLLELRSEFDDERWLKAMQLLEESYRDRPIAYGVSFYRLNEKTGKDELIPLSFSSVDLIEEKTSKDEQ